MANFSFDDILVNLKSSSNKSIYANFEVSELSLNQQRKIGSVGLYPIEIPARISIVYNNLISEAVHFTDQVAPVDDYLTIDQRRALLMALRIVSMGNEATIDNKKYILKAPDISDFKKQTSEEIISFGEFTITIDCPVLSIENYYYNILLEKLAPFSKKKGLTDEDYITLSSIYQLYDMMKFIKSFTYNGENIDFASWPNDHRERFINELPQSIAIKIATYINNIKDREDALFTAEDPETHNTVTINNATLFNPTPIAE